MELHYRIVIALLLLTLLNASCKQEKAEQINEQVSFTSKSPADAGISFENTLTELPRKNPLVYETFYNGGGIAIGDINNDGLVDVYFGGNQVKDQLYLNKGDWKFEEVSDQVGILDRGGWSSGISMIDINADGWLDIYVCKTLYDESPELRSNELYINKGDGTFEEQGASYGLADYWRTQEANFFDYDMDGDLDVLLVNQPPNPGLLSPLKGQDWRAPDLGCRFLENQKGKFVDKTEEVGLAHSGYALSSSVADFNNDGWADIYIAHDYDSPDRLYINQRNKTYKNTTNESMKHISFFSMGTDAADINNDGWIDLMAVDMVAADHYRNKANMGGMNPEAFWQVVDDGGHYQYMYNTLQLNYGLDASAQLHFGDIAQMTGMSSTDWSWSPLIADFNNDGEKDIFISNGIKRDLRFTDALNKIKTELKRVFKEGKGKINQKNIWDHVDMIAMLELMPSTPLQNYLFENQGELHFENQASVAGLTQKGFSSGSAYGDLDNDGDLDLIVSNIGAAPYLYENNANQSGNNYLQVELKSSMPTAIGSRVEIYYDGKMQTAETTVSRGFYSTSQQILHFGLGKADKIDSLFVYWPGRRKERFEVKGINQRISLERSRNYQFAPDKHYQKFAKNQASTLNLDIQHIENEYNDFERQVLLPHKLSELGPCIKVGDLNGDEREDLFVGASVGQASQIYLQTANGTFEQKPISAFIKDKKHEDIDAVIFDFDQDGDQDVYVVSGGNEYEENNEYYSDRLYINDGKGNFVSVQSALPDLRASGGAVAEGDFDGDGDTDLFIGNRHRPGSYPFAASSYLLVNQLKETGQLIFVDKSKELAPELNEIGMVTTAQWTDYDADKDLDLILSGEWMPITILENEKGQLTNASSKLGLEDTRGWWFSVQSTDLNEDGYSDFLLGNLGENYKYKITDEESFAIYFGDYNQNGSSDIILSHGMGEQEFPIRGRSCSSEQMPEIKKKFVDYHSFANADLKQIYGNQLDSTLRYEVDQFSSMLLINRGGEGFDFQKLPSAAQVSSIQDFIVLEDEEGKPQILGAGNFHGAEIETPRSDAGVGLWMNWDGNKLDLHPAALSGWVMDGQVKCLEKIAIDGELYILGLPNRGQIVCYKWSDLVRHTLKLNI